MPTPELGNNTLARFNTDAASGVLQGLPIMYKVMACVASSSISWLEP